MKPAEVYLEVRGHDTAGFIVRVLLGPSGYDWARAPVVVYSDKCELGVSNLHLIP
jgi:hypothetical protein